MRWFPRRFGNRMSTLSISLVCGLKVSIVITIQNGLGAGERIAEFMDTDRVLLGVADGFGASMKGPGQVYHSAMNLIRVGEMNGGMSERL